MIKIYPIILPSIPSGQLYNFVTDNDIEYEVRFARKKDNILHVITAFGVLNEEFEDDEYALTNKGDIFRVMNTISTIIKIYFSEHLHIRIFEFTGVNKPGESDITSQRSLLYMRYLPKIFNKDWKVEKNGNNFIVKRLV
jgi:hypothetical protein